MQSCCGVSSCLETALRPHTDPVETTESTAWCPGFVTIDQPPGYTVLVAATARTSAGSRAGTRTAWARNTRGPVDSGVHRPARLPSGNPAPHAADLPTDDGAVRPRGPRRGHGGCPPAHGTRLA